jgi:hypothetical protein
MKLLAAVLAVLVLLTAVYKSIYSTTSYRVRLTLNVETPQGLKTGSGVVEVTTRSYPAWTTLGGSTGNSWVTGDAVFVDLGEGANGCERYLVALLASGLRGEDVDFYRLPMLAYEHLWRRGDHSSDWRDPNLELSKLPPGTRVELSGKLIPTLVTFFDTRDPNTARVVRPDGLAQSFGDTVHLRDVTLETVSSGIWPLNALGLTGEPITRGIETHLPFLVTQRDRLRRLIDDLPPRFQPHYHLFTR